MIITELIKSLLENIMCESSNDLLIKLKDKKQTNDFQKQLLKRIEEYVNHHDGSVLTSDDFNNFIKYHNVIQNIFDQVLYNKNNETKDSFIDRQITLFYDVQEHHENNQHDTKDSLRGFINIVYDEIDNIFKKNLSQNENYMLSKQKEYNAGVLNEIENNNESVLTQINELKKTVINNQGLTDPEQIWSIFQRLASLILKGHINDVIEFYPLIVGKSKDLESSISYLLNLLSDYQTDSINFDIIQRNVKDDRIYNYICRIAIYINVWRKNSVFFKRVSNRNLSLHGIAQSLVKGEINNIYIEKEEIKDQQMFHEYKLSSYYSDESWLIFRICLVKIWQEQPYNAYNCIAELVQTPNIIDSILMLDCQVNEIYKRNKISDSLLKEIYDKTYKLAESSSRLREDLKILVYKNLLKVSIKRSQKDAESALKLVPKDICEAKVIKFLLLQIEIDKEDIQFDDILCENIIQTCMKYNEYWIFNNFLIKFIESQPLKVKALIEKYIFIVDYDLSVFLLYIHLLNRFEKKDKAISMLEKYKDKYGNILEYLIVRASICNTPDEELDGIVSKYINGNLSQFSNEGWINLVKLLFEKKRYKNTLEVIKVHEAIENPNDEIVKIKAFTLLNLGCELEALSLFKELFNAGMNTDSVVGNILLLSNIYKRKVSCSVLESATHSENPKILSLAAGAYATENNIEAAIELNIKGMLRTTDEQSNIFNQFFGISLLKKESKTIDIKCVDVNTAVVLQNVESESKQTYVIYSNKILPEEPYIWKKSVHIYKERAIKYKLIRKYIGDTVVIDKVTYKIIEVVDLNTYFGRICMDKLVENQEARKITIPTAEGKIIDLDKFVQDMKGCIVSDENQQIWLEQYKDLNKLPLTFFCSKRFVNVEYFQLIRIVLRDSSILFRENDNFQNIDAEEYVFTSAALAVLHELGWKNHDKDSKYIVPSVMKKEITLEEEAIIRNNNQEHVSFMGMKEGKIYITERAEESKQQCMEEAIGLKEYVDDFCTLDNFHDLYIEGDYHFDIKEVLGITDYDAISIAKNTNKTLVSAEIMITGICQFPTINISPIGIADFLTEEVKDINELLNYIRKMMEYRCTVPFTLNTLYRLQSYIAEHEEKKDDIVNKFRDILQSTVKDNYYNEYIFQYIGRCLEAMHFEKKHSILLG